ncbi:unnamed protein product [Leptidea sinapis]|uniref:Uncharacterized protein n=1 Tax=Leptidea sinapis TaxID=189913 RepID=A0A5E4QKK8_9NEOP|nr:unnamed protein product [Leptidea sinapis]
MAQYFEDPTKMFEPMEFDAVHRGSFNITQCIQDVLNCYAIVKPDEICSEYSHTHASICSAMRHWCDDHHGYQEDYVNGLFHIYESFCRPYHDLGTRRNTNDEQLLRRADNVTEPPNEII